MERDYELFLEGHTNMIKSLVLTNDNKHLIPGDSSGESRVWNFQDNSEEYVLRGHHGSLNILVVTSDKSILSQALMIKHWKSGHLKRKYCIYVVWP